MRTSQIKKKLRLANEILEEVKQVTGAAVETARVLLNENEIHSLQGLALDVASKSGMIESNLSEFARMGVHSKKFVPKGK